MTSLRSRVAAAALLAASLTGAGLAAAPIATAAAPVVRIDISHHACTRTSSGKCIRGGEFCPQRDYHHSGWDAQGRRYVCKGSRVHPHWERP